VSERLPSGAGLSNPAFYFSSTHGRRSDGKEIALPSGDQFAAELDDFGRCILNDEPSKVGKRRNAVLRIRHAAAL